MDLVDTEKKQLLDRGSGEDGTYWIGLGLNGGLSK